MSGNERKAVICRHCGAVVPTSRLREYMEMYRREVGLPRLTVSGFSSMCGLGKATLTKALEAGYMSRETARRICVVLNAVTGRTGKRNAYTWEAFFPDEEV